MAATSKLTVWNDALREIGQDPLVNTTDANQAQLVLDGAFGHAVEYTLGRLDWNFARRRIVLGSTGDTTFPPFTRRYARPGNYLRKCWIKANPADEFQIDHTESGLFIYGFVTAPVIEFISDDPANYEPANWPPHFTRCLSLYLATLVAPKIGRTGDDETARALWQKLNGALVEAEQQEVVFTTNRQIEADRLPVMRRALEMIGQVLSGSAGVQAQADYLRWAMDRTWADCVAFMLAQAPWNFAVRRTTLTGIADASFAPYTYRYERPASMVRRVWLRAAPSDTFEADYADVGGAYRSYAGTLVLEYIASDAAALQASNWPVQFREAVAAYLAMQVAGRVTLSGDQGGDNTETTASKVREAVGKLFQGYLDAAKSADATTFMDRSVPSDQLPVHRRALEFIGQALAGFGAIDDAVGRLRWAMVQAWPHSVRFCLEAGAWNFASKRCYFKVGNPAVESMPLSVAPGIDDGYSVIPDDPSIDTDVVGFQYAFPLPKDFRHKLWFKERASDERETRFEILRDFLFTDLDGGVLEYVAEDEWTTSPTNWPATFLDVVAAHLAASVALELAASVGERGSVKITATQLKEKLEVNYRQRADDARNKDAIQQLPKRVAVGSFARARFGGNRYGYR